MSEAVAVAIVSAIASVMVAGFTFLGVLVSRSNGHAKRAAAIATSAATNASSAARDASAARAQVENDHTTNLREEQDERHGENTSKLDAVLSALGEVRADIGGIRSDVRQLYRQDARTADRITDIEQTIPKGPARPWVNTPRPIPPMPGTAPSEPSSKDSPWT